jgi:antitoxin (DNA-binding transcriptional repressor) of toxin-antitoxin stability system
VTIRTSTLRADIYRLLDHVLATGEPIEVERHGRLLRIVAVEPASRLDALPKRPDYVRGDPDDLVHLDWSSDWNP